MTHVTVISRGESGYARIRGHPAEVRANMSADQNARTGARLRAARKARGLVVADLAELFREVAAEKARKRQPALKHIERTIRGHEAGEHAVGPRYRLLWARALQMDEAELFAEPAATTASFRDETISGAEDDVKRRTLLGLLATSATIPLAQQAEMLRAALTEAVTSVPTDRDADAWERVAFDYAHEVGAMPAAQLLPELLADFAEINTLVSQAHGAVRLRVIHTAAQLAALTAITLTNLSDPRSARRWWRTASRAADESGDLRAASLVRGRQAVFSLYEDRPSLSILDVADEAIEIGHNTACAGVASGYAAKAQALAQLGQHAKAVEALEDLERVFDQLPDTVRNDRASQWGWSAQRLHHVTSHVYTFAGDVPRADRAQAQALALYPEGNYQGRAQIELHRAGCLMRAGDVDEGARHTVRVLRGLPTEHADDGLLRRTALRSLELAPPVTTVRPAVREAYELLALTPGDQ